MENEVWELSSLPGAEWAREMLDVFPLDPPMLEGPFLSTSPLLPPAHAPRTNMGGGGLGEWRTWPRSPTGFPGPEWVGEMPVVLPRSSDPEGPTVCHSSSSPPLPPMPLGTMWLEGVLEGRGPDPEAQQASQG